MRQTLLVLFVLCIICGVFATDAKYRDGKRVNKEDIRRPSRGEAKNRGEQPDVQYFVKETVMENDIVVFSKSYCPYCKKAKSYLNDLGFDFFTYELDIENDGKEVHEVIKSITRQRTVPNIFINGRPIGGYDSISKLSREEIESLIQK